MPIDMALLLRAMALFMDYGLLRGFIVAAVFLYKLTVASGQFDIIRSSVISITDDQRVCRCY